MADTVPPCLKIALDQVGKLHDGPDVPRLAGELAQAFPEDAAYWHEAADDTPWCAIFTSWCLMKAGIQVRAVIRHGVGPMHVDWWPDYGTPVPVSQRQPGDLAIYRSGGLHHINFVADNGECVGGNQTGASGNPDSVTRHAYRTPDAVRRPPAPGAIPVLQPSTSHRLLKQGDSGADVSELQKLLGLVPSAYFDSVTDAKIRAFQQAHGLLVDGEVGDETWPALLGQSSGKVGTLTPAVIDQICRTAAASPVARYSWENQGVAPAGYIKGMAVVFAKVYLGWKKGGSAARVMAAAQGADATKDVLAWYAPQFAAAGMSNAIAGATALRHTFVVMLGLGMRESSGRYCEGRDTSANNTSADEAESGLFQQSWNSHAASVEITNLFNAYSAGAEGFQSIFAEGVTSKASDFLIFGEAGTGRAFQQLVKDKPAFAVEAAAICLRVLGGSTGHFGPIRRHEAEITVEADQLLQQVQVIADALNGEALDPVKPGGPMQAGPAPVIQQLAQIAQVVGVILSFIRTVEKPKMPTDQPTQGLFDLTKLVAEIQKWSSLLQNPTVQKFVSGQPMTAQEMLSLLPIVLPLITGHALPALPAPGIAQPEPQPVPQPVPVPTPAPAPTPILQKPSVQISTGVAAIDAILMLFDVIGTPFGMGKLPTDNGTAAIVAPLISAAFGATGGWGAIAQVALPLIGKIFGGLANIGKPKAPA